MLYLGLKLFRRWIRHLAAAVKDQDGSMAEEQNHLSTRKVGVRQPEKGGEQRLKRVGYPSTAILESRKGS